MTDIRLVVQAALDAAFPDLREHILPEELVAPDGIPDEHITYRVTGGGIAEYADDKPIAVRDNVTVSWYGGDLTVKFDRMEDICAAMYDADFVQTGTPSDIARDPDTMQYGAEVSFALLRECDN